MFNKLNKKVKKTLAVSMSLATMLASFSAVSLNNNIFATSLSGTTSQAVLEWRNHPDDDGSLCLVIDTDGNIAINQWIIHPNGNDVCYVGNDGKMIKGWAFDNQDYYYFDTEGKMLTNQWLKHPNNSDILCFVGNDGKMIVNKWFSYNIKIKWWNFGDQNAPNRCVWVIDTEGKWSYLGKDGLHKTGYRMLPDRRNGYLGVDGKLRKVIS